MDEFDVLRRELDALEKEHRILDQTIRDCTDRSSLSQLELQRMKRKKLSLKDRISKIEDALYPDIIA